MLTPKQKLFAEGVASGLSQSDSYRRTYNAERMASATVRNKAYALMKNGKIQARIEELREPVIQQLRYGLREAMREAEQAFILAQEKGNPASMVAATMLRARLNGLLVEKREVTTTEVSLLDDATLDRLIALKALELGVESGKVVH